MSKDYSEALAAYLQQKTEAQEELKALNAAFESDKTVLATRLETAQSTHVAAQEKATEAQTLLDETESSSIRMWVQLAALVGPKRCGSLPEPTHAGCESTSATVEETRVRTQRARSLLRQGQSGELPMEPPLWTVWVAGLMGALCGFCGVVAASHIVRLQLFDTQALGNLGAVASLFIGIGMGPMLWGAWLAWRYRVRPRPVGAITATLLAVVVTVVSASFFLVGL